MTALKSVHLICNGGCGATLDIPVSKYADARESAMEDHGWTSLRHKSDTDLCRRCSRITVIRKGDEVVASHGKMVVASHRFPLNLPASEWDSLLYAVETSAERASDADESKEAYLRIAEFVRVEVMILDN